MAPRASCWAVAALLLLPSLTLFALIPGSSASADLVATLPTPRQAAAVVSDGQVAYVLGGYDWTPDTFDRFHDEVVRFDPATHDVAVVAHLPWPVTRASAVWTGTDVFVFGGQRCNCRPADQIARFTPATGEVTLMQGRLPHGWMTGSAVWDGTHAYLFGGEADLAGEDVITDQILRYDPAADRVEVLAARLPTAREETAAVWADGAAYVFGGLAFQRGGYARSDEVVRFDPATGEVQVLGTRLPMPRLGASAAWNGAQALVFGGDAVGGLTRGVVSFDPAAQTMDVVEALPTPTRNSGAAWLAGAASAYVFGGATVDPATGHVSQVDSIIAVAIEPGCFPVSIASPTASWVAGLASVRAKVPRQVSLTSVQAFVDEALLADLTPRPHRTTWDTTRYDDGLHLLRITAEAGEACAGGALREVGVDNAPPQTAITGPYPGVWVHGHVTLTYPDSPTVVVGDVDVVAAGFEPSPGSGMTRAEFFVDGRLRATVPLSDPFYADPAPRWTWPAGAEAVGPHDLAVHVVDAAGNVGAGTYHVDLTTPG